MEIVFQTMANGLLVGALYGWSLLVCSAHGCHEIPEYGSWDVHHPGGYLSYWLLELWGSTRSFAPLVVMAMFLVGLAFYKLALSPLLKLPNIGMRINASMLITFGSIWVWITR